MSATAKVSVSLPAATLAAADEARGKTGETRSEFFRLAVVNLLKERGRQAAVSRYIDGYVAEPESDFEVEAADAISLDLLQSEPW